DYVGAFGGNPQTLTPNIDKLATQGLKFNRAYCQYPVCGPSRASFLHGLYPESSKVLNNTIYPRDVIPNVANMFQHFRSNGYFTAGAGKIFHSKFGMYEKGVSLDEYEKLPHAENPQTLMLKEKFDASGEKGPFGAYLKKNKVNDQAEKVLYYGTDMRDDQHSDGRSARKVAQWIKEKKNGSKPFLMACGLVKPHVPFYAPKKYFDKYDKSKLQFSDVPEDDWTNRPKIAAVKSHARFGAEMGVNNRDNRAGYLQAYLACISFMDAQVKVLLDALDESGQRDNTVVIFMSDHGYHIGEHFMYGKVTLFEECARVPFIIHHPKVAGNSKKTESLVELIDIYPTLVELCGLPQPSFKLQGKSLVPVLKDPTAKVKDSVYTVVTRGQKLGRAIRTQRWRYAEWGSSKDIELYDLQKDPEEYNNLAGKAEFKTIVDDMKKQLKAKMAVNK
ncbi:MAG: sulfatase, partial [Lentisphaeraceae bacterium]|nr:sulfatase [Lentisphaeraceae bacterium]